MPNQFPSLTADKIRRSSVCNDFGSIDPSDLVELTPQEMGRRTSYDEPNEVASQRRKSIRTSLNESGLSPVCDVLPIDDTDKRTSDLATRRLDALIEGDAGADVQDLECFSV